MQRQNNCDAFYSILPDLTTVKKQTNKQTNKHTNKQKTKNKNKTKQTNKQKHWHESKSQHKTVPYGGLC